MKIYYIYRHIRSDTNEPFYIGIGTCNPRYKSPNKYYDRAYRRGDRDRSKFWHNVVNKTNFSVEIIFHNTDLKLVKYKETEFILLYGRRDLGTGTLVNQSFGHEGNHITPISKLAKINIKKSAQKVAKTGFFSPYGKHVFVYDSAGNFIQEYGSMRTCAKATNTPHGKILEIIKNKGPLYSYNNMVFFNIFKGHKINPPIIGNNKIKKPVNLYDINMNLIKSYIGIQEAAIDNDLCSRTVGRLCNTKKISRYHQYFRFSDDNQ